MGQSMSIPPGTPSEGEGEGSSLSKKKNRPLSIDWLGVQTIKFFQPYKFLKWGLVRAEECAKMDYWS